MALSLEWAQKWEQNLSYPYQICLKILVVPSQSSLKLTNGQKSDFFFRKYIENITQTHDFLLYSPQDFFLRCLKFLYSMELIYNKLFSIQPFILFEREKTLSHDSLPQISAMAPSWGQSWEPGTQCQGGGRDPTTSIITAASQGLH